MSVVQCDVAEIFRRGNKESFPHIKNYRSNKGYVDMNCPDQRWKFQYSV
jgi:hypothetical protein